MVAIRVYNGMFGPNLILAALRMGDLIAVCNFLEYIREKTNAPELQMYIPDDTVFPSKHCLSMRNWLEKNTNYVTTKPENLIELQVAPGTDETYPSMYNLWNIREDVSIRRQNTFDIQDKVVLPNSYKMEINKIVFNPLTDAPYNAHRNFPLSLIQTIIDSYRFHGTEKNGVYEKIIISKEPIEGKINIRDWKYSHDFEDNLKHVMTCQSYIGGDTGFSHFAGALSRSPQYLNYYYSEHTYGTTYPFNWKSKGRIIEFDKVKYKLNNDITLNEALQQIS